MYTIYTIYTQCGPKVQRTVRIWDLKCILNMKIKFWKRIFIRNVMHYFCH